MIRTAVLACLLALIACAQGPSELKYNPKADPRSDLRAALAEASKAGRNVLMDVGGEWCSWCHRMDKFVADHEELRTLLEKNFVLVKVGNGKALFQALQQRGIIIRDMNAYGLPEWVRVTVGTMEQNTRFIREINHFVAPPQKQAGEKCH